MFSSPSQSYARMRTGEVRIRHAPGSGTGNRAQFDNAGNAAPGSVIVSSGPKSYLPVARAYIAPKPMTSNSARAGAS